MAISYVGGQTGFILGSTTADEVVTFSLTGGSDSAPLNGDLVVICVVAGQTGSFGVTSLVTSGYTSLTQLTSNDNQDTALQVHYKRMTSTPDTSVTITRSNDTSSGQAYTIHVFRGVDSLSPLDVTTTTATGINTSRPDPAAITPVSTGAWIYIGTGGAMATGSTYTYSAFKAVLSTVCNETSEDCVVGSGYDDTWTSGAVDPAVSSTGSTSVNASWAAYTLALRPTSDQGPFNFVPAASVTWGSKSTASGAANPVAAASVTWAGAARAAAAFTDTAAASVTWGGSGVIITPGAASMVATASVTWNGVTIANSSLSSTAAALLTWAGKSTAGGALAAAAAASVTWTGASTATSAWAPSAAAALTWAGAAIASSAWTATAAASLTWNGVEIVSGTSAGDWSSAAAASLTWGGASTATADLTSTAVASITWNGTGIFPGAASITAGANLTWTGVTLASGSWSAAAAASLTWTGAALAASDWSANPLAALAWNGALVSAGAWSVATVANLSWIGESNGAPTTADAAFTITAIATASFTSSIVAAAAGDMRAEAKARWVSPVFKRKNVDGSGGRKDMDEEDIPFILACFLAYMETNNVNH